MHSFHGESSLQLSTPEADLKITLRGGHLAPVIFHLPGRDVSPYALAPWEPAEFPDLPPLLSVLRGDFLCLPFGGQPSGPPHGDPANAAWSVLHSDDRSATLAMDTSDTGAHVVKILSIKPQHHVIYAEHRISNLEGDFNYGNHPILDLSGLPEGTGRVTTSGFFWASVFPGAFSDPSHGETQALQQGALFESLEEVPLAAGGKTDLTRYPQRTGNDDLVMVANVPASPEQPFAWSAVVLDGYLWFSLKNPADFPATLLWMSNGGRTAPPWNGRHLGRIGVEEVCSYFSNGFDLSRQNPLADLGIPTTRNFVAGQTLSLRTAQGTALVPADFGAIRQISPAAGQSVMITGESGKSLLVPVDWNFVL
jgi:hypothetical protein